jgi:hypothetical protein
VLRQLKCSRTRSEEDPSLRIARHYDSLASPPAPLHLRRCADGYRAGYRVRAGGPGRRARPHTGNRVAETAVTITRVRMVPVTLCLLVVCSTTPLSMGEQTSAPPGQRSEAHGGCVVDSSLLGTPDLVATDRGILRGARAGDTHVFKGIPYAAPPVGELRWRSPSRRAGRAFAMPRGSAGCVSSLVPAPALRQSGSGVKTACT